LWEGCQKDSTSYAKKTTRRESHNKGTREEIQTIRPAPPSDNSTTTQPQNPSTTERMRGGGKKATARVGDHIRLIDLPAPNRANIVQRGGKETKARAGDKDGIIDLTAIDQVNIVHSDWRGIPIGPLL